MASINNKYRVPDSFITPLKFVNKSTVTQMLNFPDDMITRQPMAVNKLNNQVLVEYFEEEWGKYLEQ